MLVGLRMRGIRHKYSADRLSRRHLDLYGVFMIETDSFGFND